MVELENIGQKIGWNKLLRYGVRYFGVPVLLVLIIETLNHKSLVGGVQYMLERPLLFLFNTLIIMLTISMALFFKREIFVFTVISAVWLIFGIVNFIILQIRVTPFSAVDITLLESAISVSGHYLNPLNIAMIGLAAALVIVLMVALYKKAPKHTHVTQKKMVFSGILVALITVAIFFLKSQSHSVQALNTSYTNISEAYENYGFVYCFTNSIIDTGIEKPEDYSEERVKQVLGDLPEQTAAPKEKPNIIFIQLESFFDVNTIEGLTLSADPVPNFHELQKRYSFGLLTVPTVGAGTVNTEFEVLTGLSQKDFGTSEYPYKTILRSTTSESVCYDLKKLGYSTHCVHNNEGTFYGRNKVFANLGFDTFTSMEYMNGLEDNPNGWKKDRVLVGEILDTLDSTKGPDFTLGITVQSHGKYAGFEVGENAPVIVKTAPEGMEESYAYYVNQLYEVDQMIGDLVKALERRKEKTVLVLYGDHLPSLDIQKEQLKDSNLYQTQYVVWDNMGLDRKIEENYTSYQLYPEILKRLHISEGNITRYHQGYSWRTKTYHENLKLLAYDMLYGENYAYEGEKPFEPVELQMGTGPVVLTDVEKNDRGYLLKGSGFTPYAHVLFQGRELASEYVSTEAIQILEELVFEEEDSKEEDDTGEEAAASPAPTESGTKAKSADGTGKGSRTDSQSGAKAGNEKSVEKSEASPEPTEKPTREEEWKAREEIPNAFLVQIQSDGGTVLSVSEVLRWEDTALAE